MALASTDLELLESDASLRSAMLTRLSKNKKFSPRERNLDPDWATCYWVGLPCATTVRDWKRYFAEHHFQIKSAATLESFEQRAKRCGRGLPSYDGHNVGALKVLVRDRGLGTYLARKANKEQLVQLLEAADDEQDAFEASREFPKFLELPPELKNRVYTFYFQSLGRVPPRFILPPLCRASRQLRLESTGLFFEHSTFILWLRPEFRLSRGREQARLQYHTEVARINVSIADFARIKHLHVELRDPYHQFPLRTWAVDLTNGQCEVDFTNKKVAGKKKLYVQKLVESITAREGSSKLKKSDLGAFEIAVSKEYWTSGAWS